MVPFSVGVAVAPKADYQPSEDERRLTPKDGMSGGTSYFATPKDASTRGRKMGISGEPADQPWDVWYCAMRFGYTEVEPHRSGRQDWVQGKAGTSDMALKQRAAQYRLKVTNPATGKAVVVRPADWGPAPVKRVIDLSETALRVIGAVTDTFVKVEWVDKHTPLGPVL